MSIASIPQTALNGDVARKSDNTAGVKSDTLALLRKAIGIMVNSSTTVKVKTILGDTVTLALTAGVPVMLEISQVFSTDTTATNAQIVLFYSQR